MSEQTSRRAILKTIAGSAAAFPILGQNPPPDGQTADATTQREAAYRFRHFEPAQLKILSALTETIIPTDEHSPGAKAAGVSEYIDAIVADGPASLKEFWDDGLAMANRMAYDSYGRSYGECEPEEQVAIMSVLAGNEREPSSPEERFFMALKRATIDGYYTSKIGIHQELEYQGNQALRAFPGCQHDEGR